MHFVCLQGSLVNSHLVGVPIKPHMEHLSDHIQLDKERIGDLFDSLIQGSGCTSQPGGSIQSSYCITVKSASVKETRQLRRVQSRLSTRSEQNFFSQPDRSILKKRFTNVDASTHTVSFKRRAMRRHHTKSTDSALSIRSKSKVDLLEERVNTFKEEKLSVQSTVQTPSIEQLECVLPEGRSIFCPPSIELPNSTGSF